jgi:hypothetical protein
MKRQLILAVFAIIVLVFESALTGTLVVWSPNDTNPPAELDAKILWLLRVVGAII